MKRKRLFHHRTKTPLVSQCWRFASCCPLTNFFLSFDEILRMHSSGRQRTTVGRSNISSESNHRRPVTAAPVAKDGAQDKSSKPPTFRESPRPFTAQYSPSQQTNQSIVSTARMQEINDPIFVFRPKFTAEIFDKTPTPIVLGPQYSTVQTKAKTPRRLPLSCPDEWIEKNQRQKWYEKADQRTNLDDELKTRVSREFVEANRDQMWKYNIDFLNKTPRTVCNSLVESENFIGMYETLAKKESKLRLSSSDKFKTCFNDEHLSSIQPPVKDMSLTSLKTGRSVREERIVRMLAPSSQHYSTTNHRGYQHDNDWRNFSHYNSILKTNEGAILKR